MDGERAEPGRRTPLHDLHLAHGGKIVQFAGYDLPVQYAAGVLKEHLHTREAAGLFDVSHMGQVELRPRGGDLTDVALALEQLVPADVVGLAPNRQRYGIFTNASGGILDDLMIANLGDRLYLVVNAACKADDIEHLRRSLSEEVEIVEHPDRALLALQGPLAEAALSRLGDGFADLAFMGIRELDVAGVRCTVSRSGYTGEDGFEIGMPGEAAVHVAQALLAIEGVKPIGLAARDSLRLEAGLCLYGSDLTVETTPVEAALEWSIQKSRRPGGARAGGYPGAEVIEAQLAQGASRRRVGLRPPERTPVRSGTLLYDSISAATPLGQVTSGGFGPSVAGAVSMAYVPIAHAAVGSVLYAEVRGMRLPVTVSETPFIQKTYKR